MTDSIFMSAIVETPIDFRDGFRVRHAAIIPSVRVPTLILAETADGKDLRLAIPLKSATPRTDWRAEAKALGFSNDALEDFDAVSAQLDAAAKKGTGEGSLVPAFNEHAEFIPWSHPMIEITEGALVRQVPLDVPEGKAAWRSAMAGEGFTSAALDDLDSMFDHLVKHALDRGVMLEAVRATLAERR